MSGQFVERNGCRNEWIKQRIIEQRRRGVEAAGMRPARAPLRGNVADLARDQPQPLGMERAAKRDADLRIAEVKLGLISVPIEFEAEVNEFTPPINPDLGE